MASAYLNSGLGIGPRREWPDPLKAPGGDVARLLAVRVRTEGGEITDVRDIRQSVKIEMEYEVIAPGYKLMPHFLFTNQEGIHAFSAHDVDPSWRGRLRPAGKYLSSAWIPGNLLTEGTLFVAAGVRTIDPRVRQLGSRNPTVSWPPPQPTVPASRGLCPSRYRKFRRQWLLQQC
jgi:lipopolysaccharide transport system ATP-binding protein